MKLSVELVEKLGRWRYSDGYSNGNEKFRIFEQIKFGFNKMDKNV